MPGGRGRGAVVAHIGWVTDGGACRVRKYVSVKVLSPFCCSATLRSSEFRVNRSECTHTQTLMISVDLNAKACSMHVYFSVRHAF